MSSILTARWPLPVLASVLAGALASACGNKGDLFLPSTLDDERRLQRIETGLPGPVEPVEPDGPGNPGNPDGGAPQRLPPTGSMPVDPLDPDSDPDSLADPDDPGSPGADAPRRGAGS